MHARLTALACLLKRAYLFTAVSDRLAAALCARNSVGSAQWAVRCGSKSKTSICAKALPNSSLCSTTPCHGPQQALPPVAGRLHRRAHEIDPAAAAVAREASGMQAPGPLHRRAQGFRTRAGRGSRCRAPPESSCVGTHRLRVADCSGFRDLAQIEMGVPSGNERFHEFATVANGRQGRVRAWATVPRRQRTRTRSGCPRARCRRSHCARRSRAHCAQKTCRERPDRAQR